MSDDPNFYDCLDRLAPDVEPKVASLIEASFSSEPNALERALMGEETPAAGTRPDGLQSPPVYLSRVTVQGFRGIGPKTVLDLQPGPGLSIITGRNGCGKSSFAEAIELALTEKNSRWTDVERSREMEGGWRNLHKGDNARV